MWLLVGAFAAHTHRSIRSLRRHAPTTGRSIRRRPPGRPAALFTSPCWVQHSTDGSSFQPGNTGMRSRTWVPAAMWCVWRFCVRPSWARRRSDGEPCQALSVQGKRRCRWHGGCSTGPPTADGRARSLANLRQYHNASASDGSIVAPTAIQGKRL